jgi:hypothetical protein
MLNTLTVDQQFFKITPEEFEEFERCRTIYILEGKPYGRAFCEHFGLGKESTLYYFKDENICRLWIRDNYGVGNEAKIH